MTERLKNVKIRTKFAGLLILTGIVSVTLFEFMWYKKWNVYEFLKPVFHLASPHGDYDFFDLLVEEAPKYDVPKSEEDTEAIEKIQPFLELADDYTSLYIYGSDGTFRAGKWAKIMDDSLFRAFFDRGYQLTGGVGEGYRELNLEFRNGKANVMIFYYHNIGFLYPYAVFCVLLSGMLFLIVILYFISRKMKQVSQIETSILQMASGDLTTPTPKYGGDEIGILSSELDKLRITLNDTLRQEQESR